MDASRQLAILYQNGDINTIDAVTKSMFLDRFKQIQLITQLEELDTRISQCKRDIELYEQRKVQILTT